MRLSKVVWATLGAAALFACRGAAGEAGCGCASGCGAGCGTGCCGGGDLKDKLCQWGVTCHNEVAVMWYAPYPLYPNYFGPPYPATSYLPVSYAGGPAETAIAVRNQLNMMGIPPVPLKEDKGKETLPPPKDGKEKDGKEKDGKE
jgi:hypothetical protein